MRAQHEIAEGSANLVVGDERNVGQGLLEDRERQLAGRREAHTIGDGRWWRDADALALPEGEPRVVGAVRLDAVDLHLGPQRPRHRAAAGHEPTASHGRQQRVHSGRVGQ